MSDDDVGKLFRSLPDEDPPAGGMASLMAAARAKAAEMAPAKPEKSLWARFVDGFRQPPVLALATVVVLVGGAVIVKNHGSAMDASDKVTMARDVNAGEVSAVTSTMSAPAVVAPTAPPVAAAGSAAAPVVAPEEKREAKEVRGPAAALPPPAPHRPPGHTWTPKADPTPEPDLAGARLDKAPESAGAPLPPPPPPPPPPAQAIATDELETGAVPVAKPTVRMPPAAVTAPVAPSPALVEQLLHACRAAAQKRDCPTARTLASQIQAKDAGFYSARVLKDADIVKCL